MEQHLRFFNSDETIGRVTGSPAFDRAAAYTASRMQEFGLQPGLDSGFRIPYVLPLSRPVQARLVMTNGSSDTLALFPGVDFLPDVRTGTNSVSAEWVEVVPAGATEATGEPVIMLPAEQASTEYLRAARQAGTEAALVVGPLAPLASAEVLPGFAVLQVNMDAAARLLSTAPAALDAFLEAEASFSWSLPRPLHLQVTTDYRPARKATNIIGMVPGEHPSLAYDMVLVCADLDVVGSLAGVQAIDFDNLGLGAAVVLEVARRYAIFSSDGFVPERTVMFAVLSGRQQGHAGLRGYLKNPLWSLRRTEAVIFVGLEPENVSAVEEMLQPYGIPLYVVPPPEEPLYQPEVILRPEPAVQALARRQRIEFDAPPNPNMEAIIEQAAAAADTMARETHRRLLPLTVSSGSFKPADEDTLPVPEVSL